MSYWLVLTRSDAFEKSNELEINSDLLRNHWFLYDFIRLFFQYDFMKTKTQLFLELWFESRTRFTNQLENSTTLDLTKKLNLDKQQQYPVNLLEDE